MYCHTVVLANLAKFSHNTREVPLTSPVINSEWKMITMALAYLSQRRDSFSDQKLSIFVARIVSNELLTLFKGRLQQHSENILISSQEPLG